MEAQIRLGEITVDVVLKDIKNIHLSVYPPDGQVRISAPAHMDLETIRVYAISKLDWIRKEQRKFRGQARETPREFIERESHFVWGKRYLLKLIEVDEAPRVELAHEKLVLRVRPDSNEDKRREIIEEWYRSQIRQVAGPMMEKWEAELGVKAEQLYVQRMKTKWGSCNPVSKSIRLNTELAKKPVECLEYIVVHELLHLIEPTHNERFVSLMDHYLPHWKHLRDELNRAPLAHVDWEY